MVDVFWRLSRLFLIFFKENLSSVHARTVMQEYGCHLTERATCHFMSPHVVIRNSARKIHRHRTIPCLCDERLNISSYRCHSDSTTASSSPDVWTTQSITIAAPMPAQHTSFQASPREELFDDYSKKCARGQTSGDGLDCTNLKSCVDLCGMSAVHYHCFFYRELCGGFWHTNIRAYPIYIPWYQPCQS